MIIYSEKLVMRCYNLNTGILSFYLAIFLSLGASAANEAAQSLTIDGVLFKAGTTTALLDSSVLLKIQVINPDGTCLLYEEQQTVDTSSTKGYFNIKLGSVVGATKRTVNDPGRSMAQIFQNSTAILANSVPGQTCAAGSYVPTAGDVRYFRITVTPSSTNIADTLAPDIVSDSVPQAIVAQSLQGLEKSNVLQVNNAGSVALSQANLEALFTTPAYANLQAILNGNYMGKDGSGAALPSFAANPPGIAAGDLWFDSTSGQVKYYDGTGVQTVGAGGAGISSLTTSSSFSINGSVAGTISSGSGTLDLTNTGVTAGTYAKVTVDAKGRVSAGANLAETDIPTLSTAGKVSGNAITSGTISGSTSINTSGNLVTTGTVSGLTAQVTNLRLYNGADYAQLSAAAMSGNVNFTLPATTGSVGQVLSTDGNGILNWISTGLPSLLSGKMWLGNGSNVATAVDLSGDATISNSGVLTLNTVPVTKGGTGTTSMAANRIVGSNGTGSAYQAFTCSLNQVISFDASGNATCSNVSALASMYLNGGNSFAGSATLGTNDNYSLSFEVNNTTAMTISQSGSVGIGTATPAATLSVKPSAAGNVLRLLSSFSSVAGNFSVTGGGHGKFEIMDGGNVTRFDLDANTGKLNLISSDGIPFVSLDSMGGSNFILGNFGIGNSVPSSALDISGAFTARGMSSAPAVSPSRQGRIYFDYASNKFKVSENGAAYADIVTSVSGSGGFVNAGNSFSGSAVLGTNDNHSLSFEVNNTTAMTISQSGNVGIGTTSPRSTLDANGTILGKPAVSNGTATVDFSTGNLQYTASNCGAFNLHNMKDGGSYTFVVQGATSSTCSFSAFSDAGSTAITMHLPPDHAATTVSKHTLYTFVVLGTHVYTAWVTGY